MAGYLFTLTDLRGCNIGHRAFSFAVSKAESKTAEMLFCQSRQLTKYHPKIKGSLTYLSRTICLGIAPCPLFKSQMVNVPLPGFYVENRRVILLRKWQACQNQQPWKAHSTCLLLTDRGKPRRAVSWSKALSARGDFVLPAGQFPNDVLHASAFCLVLRRSCWEVDHST